MPQVKYPGVAFDFGGETYIVPPLGLGKVRELYDLEQAANSTGEKLDFTNRLVFEAIRRNYPEVTMEQVLEMVDAESARRVADCAFGRSTEPKIKGETSPITA